MAIEDFERLVEEQEGRCAVCGSLPKPGRRLHVDHDHHTRQVRALLCNPCNIALGMMAERVDLIDLLSDYAHHASVLREEIRRRPRSVLGVPFRARHPLTQLFERVPDKSHCAQGLFAVADNWRRTPPQRELPLSCGVEEFWPTPLLDECRLSETSETGV